jgi:hypothetical protein
VPHTHNTESALAIERERARVRGGRGGGACQFSFHAVIIGWSIDGVAYIRGIDGAAHIRGGGAGVVLLQLDVCSAVGRHAHAHFISPRRIRVRPRQVRLFSIACTIHVLLQEIKKRKPNIRKKKKEKQRFASSE